MVSLGFTPWQGFSFRLETWPRTGDCSTQCVWGKGGAKLVPQDRKLSLSENVERTRNCHDLWWWSIFSFYKNECQMIPQLWSTFGSLPLTARAECPKWGTLGPIEGSIFFPWVKYWGYPKKVNWKMFPHPFISSQKSTSIPVGRTHLVAKFKGFCFNDSSVAQVPQGFSVIKHLCGQQVYIQEGDVLR